MRVPVWLTLGVAVLVCVFGAYRIRLAFRSDEEDERARSRKGLYAMARRTHFLIGVVYLLLGAGLVATSFGWTPLGSMFSSGTDAPSKDAAPSKDTAPSKDVAPSKDTAPSPGSAAEQPPPK